MKMMKRIASLLLAMVMVIGMSLNVFADETGGYTITIKGKEGHTYEVYQIFKGDLHEEDDKVVLSNIVWGSGVSADGQTALGDAAEKAETLKTEADAQAFAKALDTYLTNAKEMTANGDTYTYTTAEPGYYLIKDEDGSQEGTDGTYTAYMLKVVKDVTATPKDSVPTVDKSVTSDGTNADDVNVGDTVTFILKATLGDNIAEFEKYKVVFHDTLSTGLTFKEYVSATLDGKDVTSNFTPPETGNELTFSCDDVKTLGATDGSVITITYTATLNANAYIGSTGNSNKVYLEYSNDPTHSGEGTPPTGNTPEDEVLVFTYELDVTKVDGTNEETKLKDAEFVLYRVTEDVNEYVVVDANGKVTEWTTNKDDASVLKSDEKGLFKVIGLDAGVYYLEETKAPSGYNLLEDPIKVEISATLNTAEDQAKLEALQIEVDDGDVKNGDVEKGIVSTQVVNNAGSTLPETGGMGTTMFYLIGGVLVVAAVVLLVTKKRMNA